MEPHESVRESVREMEPHGSRAVPQMEPRGSVRDSAIKALKQLIKAQAYREVEAAQRQ